MTAWTTSRASPKARAKFSCAVLAACLYCWLTIATTTDVNLITNRASSPLPIIQTAIPIVGFYVVAPLLVLCVYFYFHFYLQKLWEELGSLPAVFPDGRPLHTKVDPWLLNDLVRAHLPKLNVGRPFLSYLQLWISVLLAWWIVPITMLLFWGRYLRRHEWIGTTFHVLLLVISIVAAVSLYRLAVGTMRGVKRDQFTSKAAFRSRRGYQTAGFAVAAGIVFGLISLGAIRGVRSSKPIAGIPMPSSEQWRSRGGWLDGRWTWVPRWMALIGNPPFANLTSAEISQKKSTWTRKNDNETDADSVIGAQLRRANLRYASAESAFFAGADMLGADLTGADLLVADLSKAYLPGSHLGGAFLLGADLRAANLADAHLEGAELTNANLRGANLHSTDLSGANLFGANLFGSNLADAHLKGTFLIHTDFRNARNMDVVEVVSARFQTWKEAFYDCKIIEALHLPLDNNVKLFEVLHDKEHPPKQGEEKPESCPFPKR